MKIHIVTPVPSPYRISLFNEVHRQCAAKGWTLKVVFLTAGYERRKWEVDASSFGFEHVILKNPNLASGESFFSFAGSLPALLWKERPDKVLVAGFSMSSLWTALYGSLFGIPFGVWSGETIAEEALRKGRYIRLGLRRFIARRSTFFVAYGSAAVGYLLSLGVDRSKISIGINTVNTAYMESATRSLYSEREEWKRKNGLPGFNALFVGYLERRKGVRELIDAFAEVSGTTGSSMGLHIVGSGSDEHALRESVSSKGLGNVYFWGYRQQAELPRFFSFADILVFPSLNELYGLVPIEAMAAGIPVLCSKYAGCTTDLIVDGVNGLVIDPANSADVADKIKMVYGDPDLRSVMGKNAAETVRRRFSLEASAAGFLHAFANVVDT